VADFGSIGSLLGAAGIGGAIGQAIVRLELDSSKYNAELAAAETKTTASANTMGTGFSKFAGFAKTAMLGAGVAAAAFGAYAVKAAIEAETALAALKIAVGDNTAAYEAQALALQKLTGFQDEQILSAQGQLSRFKLTEEQILDLMPLVLDYAAATGTEVPAAATNLGKALLGNTRALKTIGVEFTATGNRTKDYNTLVGLLTGSNIKGAASADTFAHSARVMTAQFDELAETAGAALIPTLTALLDAIAPLLEQARNVGIVFSVWGDVLGVILNPLGKLVDLLGGLHGQTMSLAEGLSSDVEWIRQFAEEVNKGIPVATELQGVTEALTAGVGELGSGVGEFGGVVEETGEKVHRFAGMSRSDFKEFRDSAVSALEEAGGSLDGIREKWDLTAREAVRDMERMAEMARDMAKDFKALDKDAVPEKFKAFLIEEGPAAVHAFVTGTERERGRFVAAWKQYEAATRTAVTNMEHVASGGGHQVAAALMQGLVAGIHQYTGQVIASAVSAVAQAISAARHAADAHSPSRIMRQLGQDMMQGLIDGLRSKDDALVRETQRIIDHMTRELEKQLSAAQERLSGLQGRAGSFRSTIAGGFSSFLDISSLTSSGLTPIAEDISGFFSGQVASAQTFAAVLNALKAQGANQALLSAVAGQGPQGIPFAQGILQGGPEGIASINAAYKTIANLQQATAGGITEAFFGAKIDELKDEIRHLNEELHQLKIVVKIGEQEIATVVRQQALVGAARNGGQTGF
jgi:hypothetical protein